MELSKGHVAVITGAASGIGAGIARACAEQGLRVVLADIEIGPAEALAAELEAGGVEALAVRTDVTRAEDLDALAEASFERFGATHLLFNNAGVAQGGTLHEFTPQDWDWLLAVNLYGVIHGCRSFVPRLLDQGEPAHIVNTASVGGWMSGPEIGMYCTTKFAVIAYTEALAAELGERGVGVSALCPGLVDTNLRTASRNRPAGAGRAPDRLEILSGMEEGMAPLEVGRRALRGVRENDLYIFTHPEFRPVIAARMERALAALDRAAVPVKAP